MHRIGPSIACMVVDHGLHSAQIAANGKPGTASKAPKRRRRPVVPTWPLPLTARCGNTRGASLFPSAYHFIHPSLLLEFHVGLVPRLEQQLFILDAV